MADSNSDVAAAIPANPCLHFLSKGMFVSGKLEPTHAEDGMGDGYCWCNQTQYVMGPDKTLVERTTCRPGRACYEPRV
jgi:hypothetical protein